MVREDIFDWVVKGKTQVEYHGNVCMELVKSSIPTWDSLRKRLSIDTEPRATREGEITVASHRPTSQGPQNDDGS